MEEPVAMSAMAYLVITLGVIVLVGIMCVPSLVRKNCRECGARNSLDATECTTCHAPFPKDS